LRKSLIVYRKELIDTMRDSRTVFLTLALPFILYPVLFVIIGRVQVANQTHEEQAVLQVAIRGMSSAPSLAAALGDNEQLRVMSVTLGPDVVHDGIVEVFVDVPPGHESSVLAGRESVIAVYFDATRTLSRRAQAIVVQALERYRLLVVKSRLDQLGQTSAIVDAHRYDEINVASADELGAAILSTMVPYLLVLLIASGASHTAIDATAGEKERSTLETVLVSAASRGQIIVGKFLATLSISLLTAIMGFLGLAIAASIPTSIWREVSGSATPPASSILILLAMMLPLAALLSAVFLALGCFARGMREGQTFASYVIIFVIMLAVLSVLIDVELTTSVFLVPIVGTTLALRQLLSGSGDTLPAVIAVGSTLVVAAATLWIATRLFADERVMFRQ
jgi:sodium transport system permease protein